MANTVGGYNPLINRYKTQKTDELAQKMNSYTQSVAPEANFDIGNMLNGTISSEVGSALEGSMNSLFNVGPGYNFDINAIFNKLKSQAVGMIKKYIENSLVTSILKLLAFDDTAATSARVAEGKAKTAKNTVQASALQVKLVTAGVQALMQLAETGQISQATLSQQLADIVNTGVETAAVAKELTDRNNNMAEENAKLMEEAEALQQKLEEKYSNGDKKYTPVALKDQNTEDLAKMKPEELSGDDMPEGMEQDEDYIALQEKLGLIQSNAQTMVTISNALYDTSSQLQDTEAQAVEKRDEIVQDGQQQTKDLGLKFKDLFVNSSKQIGDKALDNATESNNQGVKGEGSATVAATNATTQVSTGTPMLSNIFTAATGKKLLKNAGLNFGASAINATFGGTMFGNAFKDLVQGKSLTQIILDKLKGLAIQEANKIITQIAPNIANPFEGTIFQDTFASMTNVSGWMQEAAGQAIENPFKKLEKELEV